MPIVYGFCKAAGVNPIKFGLPVAGIMLAAHVVVPPHPGIVGGAASVKGDIGWITIIGLAICIPLAALSQVVADWLNRKGYPMLPTTAEQFAAFGNSEEDAVQLTKIVPFLVEDMLKANGGVYSKGPDWAPYVLTDGTLITGQNPASSEQGAHALLKMLG